MNNPIEIIYLTSSLIAVLAMVPQIKRILITRQSDELSLGTWVTWGCCQMVSFAYALSLHVRAYIIVNVAWITFYGVMVFLIVKYRTKPSLPRVIIDGVLRRKIVRSFWL